MFSPNIIIASTLSFLMRNAQNASCSLCETLHSSHSFLLILGCILPKRERSLRWKKIRICLQEGYSISRLYCSIPAPKALLCGKTYRQNNIACKNYQNSRRDVMKSICVFCGSSDSVHADYLSAAR